MVPPSSRGSPLGPEFDQWFLRACNRDPALRFASPVEQVEMLARALGQPTSAEANLESLRSNPGASGDSLTGPGTQVSPGARRGSPSYGGETIAQSGNTLVSSSSSTGGRVSVLHPPRRKAVFYMMISGAFLLVIIIVMFSKKGPDPASTVLATQVPAAPTMASSPSTGTPVAAPAPPTASTEAAPAETASAVKPGGMVVATPLPGPGKRKEPPPRPTPARSAPIPGPTHGERSGINDPLGDQK
jgi:hypothetical protein